MSFVETMCTWDDCGSDAIYCVDHAREFMRHEIDALTRRAEAAEALLRSFDAVWRAKENGYTHWEGCEDHHPRCKMIKMVEAHFAQWSGK